MNITTSEQKIIDLIVTGKGTKDVAVDLNMQPHSVSCALTIIFKKCSVKSRKELIAKFRVNAHA